MALAGEDISKVDEVVQLPLEKCLLYLAYLNDKAILESEEIKAATAKP